MGGSSKLGLLAIKGDLFWALNFLNYLSKATLKLLLLNFRMAIGRKVFFRVEAGEDHLY